MITYTIDVSETNKQKLDLPTVFAVCKDLGAVTKLHCDETNLAFVNKDKELDDITIYDLRMERNVVHRADIVEIKIGDKKKVLASRFG